MHELLAEFGNKFHYYGYFAIMMIGLYAMIAKTNLLKKCIGLGIFQTAIMLFYVSIGAKDGATIPIVDPATGTADPTLYANPLPQVLMLTAIVVSVATLGVALALVQIIHRDHGTIEEDEILQRLRGK
jgi:multicomponent Na+:H+ antiporter subunit C